MRSDIAVPLSDSSYITAIADVACTHRLVLDRAPQPFHDEVDVATVCAWLAYLDFLYRSLSTKSEEMNWLPFSSI